MSIRRFAARRALRAMAVAGALAAAPAETRATSSWAIDPTRTHIDFVVDAVAFPQTHGEFKKFEGRIAVDFDRPERSRAEFVVNSASVELGSSSFDDFVRGEAMLNAPRYPEIGFVSTSVKKLDERTVRVSGNLTLLGVTRPLDVDVQVQRDGARKRLEFSAKAKIDRLEFGMNSGYPVISRDVELTISSEAFES